MTWAIAAVLVAIVAVLCTVLGLAGGALWRLGSRVGGFEVAVMESRVQAAAASQAAATAVEKAEAAVVKSEAAVTKSDTAGLVWNKELMQMVRDVQEDVRGVIRKQDDLARGQREMRDAVTLIHQLDSRVTRIEGQLFSPVEREDGAPRDEFNGDERTNK